MNPYASNAAAAFVAAIIGMAPSVVAAQTAHASATASAAATAATAATAAKSCAACHGPHGNSPDPQFPKLAGQYPGYLADQLWAFRTKARRSQVMASVAARLSGTEIAALARFYADQPIRSDTVADSRLDERGRGVFYDGTGWTPPCAQCHGRRGGFGAPMRSGMMGPGMMGRGMSGMSAPNLYGLHARYIVAQLQQFARGERPSWIMGRIAAGLTPQDRKAVAEYLSGRR